MSRGITLHGFALNCNVDLSWYGCPASLPCIPALHPCTASLPCIPALHPCTAPNHDECSGFISHTRFAKIVPCGLVGKSVTSLTQESSKEGSYWNDLNIFYPPTPVFSLTSRTVTIADVVPVLVEEFSSEFLCEPTFEALDGSPYPFKIPAKTS